MNLKQAGRRAGRVKVGRCASALLGVVLVAPALRAADVAVLKSNELAAWRPAIDALRRAATGHNITEYDLRGDRAEGEKVLESLKGKNVIFVAVGPLAAQLVRDLAPEAALIFCMVQDPVKLGLLTPPNVVGVAAVTPIKNQLAAFRMVYPRGVRVGVVYNNDNTGRVVQEAQKASSIVRLVLLERPITAEKDLPSALRSLLKSDEAVDALWVPADPVLLGDDTRRFILSECFKASKPVFAFSSSLVAEGALVSDGVDFVSVGEEAGALVNRVASGQKGRLEMVIPRAELVINRKIADKLKIELPAAAIQAAQKIF